LSISDIEINLYKYQKGHRSITTSTADFLFITEAIQRMRIAKWTKGLNLEKKLTVYPSVILLMRLLIKINRSSKKNSVEKKFMTP